MYVWGKVNTESFHADVRATAAHQQELAQGDCRRWSTAGSRKQFSRRLRGHVFLKGPRLTAAHCYTLRFRSLSVHHTDMKRVSASRSRHWLLHAHTSSNAEAKNQKQRGFKGEKATDRNHRNSGRCVARHCGRRPLSVGERKITGLSALGTK